MFKDTFFLKFTTLFNINNCPQNNCKFSTSLDFDFINFTESLNQYLVIIYL